ncbi:MAG TPA: alpha/beta fold hydrolase [Candidatus Dormibacteraeota bacterium]
MAQRTVRLDRAHQGIDAAMLWRLGSLRYEMVERLAHDPVSAAGFWDASRVQSPAPVAATAHWEHGRSRQLRLEGPSAGPGNHPGSRKLIATAHINLAPSPDAPMILIVHGYAVPFPLWDALQARGLRARGAHTMQIDLPFHLRRRVPGRSSGDGFFGTDPARIRATVRQSVEDAAALVSWARRHVTPTVAVMGVSLGGLIASLLAAQVRLDSVVAVAPLCDPPATFLENMPRNLARRLGISPTSGGAWGEDRSEARAMLDAALAPLVPRNLVPRTRPADITLVRPELDLIVGPQPIADLAASWGAELWDYPHGHITVMSARGIGSRIRDRLLEPSRSMSQDHAAAAV